MTRLFDKSSIQKNRLGSACVRRGLGRNRLLTGGLYDFHTSPILCVLQPFGGGTEQTLHPIVENGSFFPDQ
jgi:hypothetical protein